MFRSGSIAGDFSAVSHCGHLAGAGMFRSGSIAGDFSAVSRRGHLAGAGAWATFPFREIATSRVALLAMTRRYGCTLSFSNANPY